MVMLGAVERRCRKRSAGMSLIELIVSVSVLAITMAVAIPSFTATMRSNQLATQANEVLNGLAMARAEALRQNTRISWAYEAGTEPRWVVWRDDDADGAADAAEVLRTGPLNNSIRVSGTASGFPNVVYQPDGTVTGPGWGSIWMCMPGKTPELNVRRMVVIVSGRVRTERCSCDNQCASPSANCKASDCDDAA